MISTSDFEQIVRSVDRLIIKTIHCESEKLCNTLVKCYGDTYIEFIDGIKFIDSKLVEIFNDEFDEFVDQVVKGSSCGFEHVMGYKLFGKRVLDAIDNLRVNSQSEIEEIIIYERYNGLMVLFDEIPLEYTLNKK